MIFLHISTSFKVLLQVIALTALYTSARADLEMGAPFLQAEIEQLNALLENRDADWQPSIAALLDGVVNFDALARRTFDDYLEETLDKYENNLKKEAYHDLLASYQERLVQTYRQRLVADAINRLRTVGVSRIVLGDYQVSKNKGHVDLSLETRDATVELRVQVRRFDDQWKIVDMEIDGDAISEIYREACEDIIDKEYSLPVLEARLKQQTYITLENFSITAPGDFPRDWWGWRAKKGEGPKLHQIYHVEKEGDHYYLAAQDTSRSIIIMKSAVWNPRHYPIMTWCWRVNALPPGGDERYGRTNDSAAGLYVEFSSNFIGVPKHIKYVWSTTLEEGTIGRRQRIGRPYFFVVESGEKNLGKWTFEQVDLYRDFVKVYKGKPEKQTTGLGILTDANSTASYAEAYYADIRVWTRDAQEQGLIENYCGSLTSAASIER